MRHYHWFDQIFSRIEDGLAILSQNYTHADSRPTPKPDKDLNFDKSKPLEEELSQEELKLSIRCMRVNHSGEVAAQALYLGQALVARDPILRATFKEAANEEKDHLRWCKERVLHLNGHCSYFNPLWAVGSFTIGTLAGLISDKISLSFLAETEKQVMKHLDSHLDRISFKDVKSRAIIHQMREDEEIHATTAIHAGGTPLPHSIQLLMHLTAKIMTTTAFYL